VEKRKKYALAIIAIGITLILLPNLVSSIGGGITGTPYHTVSCEVSVQRYYDQAPSIQTVSCSRRNSCYDFTLSFGEYKGNLEMQTNGKSAWQNFEVGLGTWDPKVETYTISQCVPDSVSSGVIRVYNGEKTEVLGSKTFMI
jgi:hypothetical protein